MESSSRRQMVLPESYEARVVCLLAKRSHDMRAAFSSILDDDGGKPGMHFQTPDGSFYRDQAESIILHLANVTFQKIAKYRTTISFVDLHNDTTRTSRAYSILNKCRHHGIHYCFSTRVSPGCIELHSRVGYEVLWTCRRQS